MQCPRQNWKQRLCKQCAKKVVSNSPGLVDFAIGPVNPGLDLPKGQVMFFGKFKLQKNCNQCCSSKFRGGAMLKTIGLVHIGCTSNNLPE